MAISTEAIISKGNPMGKGLISGATEPLSPAPSNRDSEKAKEYGSAKRETSTEDTSVQTAKTGSDSFAGQTETSTKVSSVKMSERVRESWTGVTAVSIKGNGNAASLTVEVQTRLHSQESLGLEDNGQGTVSSEITY